jgi:DNA-binding NtrC family response regulator
MVDLRPRICLVEDDPIMGEALAERLDLEGFQVRWHRTGLGALADLIGSAAQIAVIDINLPDISGMALFERIGRETRPTPPCVFITGCGSIEDAVRLLKLGAADYLTKPLDPAALVEKLRTLVLEAGQPRDPGTASAGAPSGRSEPVSAGLGDPLGISPAMRRVEEQLARIARHPTTPVLIAGESGVGKELVAQRLHTLQCPTAPLIAVNCAALPESLIEAELFGHEKGAFTGADRRRAGVFERAGEGILFLDEIGDMPLALQPRLLRVLQSRGLTRVGGSETIGVPARVVCATHQDLGALVQQGRFREDLYYRIKVLELRIPPLRERPEDVLWLAERFLAAHSQRFPDERRTLSAADRDRLLRHAWPGNVRELHHALERACIMGQGETLALELGPDPLAGLDLAEGLKAHARSGERAAILSVLAANGYGMIATAAALGISRKTLWQKMKRYGIARPG